MGRAWVWALITLVALSVASLTAWAALLWLRRGVYWPLFSFGFLVLLAIFRGLWRPETESRALRWDGQQWLMLATSSSGANALPGEVRILFDFSDWLLLRFTVASPNFIKRRSHYLGISRVDYADQWHVLRGALYSSAIPASRRSLHTEPH